LNTTLTPHSITHGDACFAYFNKIWGMVASAHARARSKNYAYQNWKAHLSGALRPDCGLARLWEPQIQE
jgi:hypothetical protein